MDAVDFLIIGGGTAGIPVATRLAERGHSVLIIEAGENVSASPEVRIPGLFVENLKNLQLNWAFTSTPQEHAGGRVIPLPRGKSLGGSSNINFMQLNRPSAQEFNDAFAAFGIEGWSYEDLLPYYRKFESLTANPEAFSTAHVQPDSAVHGDHGPLAVTVPVGTTPTRELFFKAMNELGVKTLSDCANGNNVGTWNSFQAIEGKGCTRASADTAYLIPSLAKLPNLRVLSGAYVTRIIFDSSTNEGDVVATGVEYTKGDSTHSVKANKEVIICAGTYQTPQILELSGIGDHDILSKFGIKTLVHSPGVGANLREVMESSSFYPSTVQPAPEPGKAHVSFHLALQYPLSRGTVHINSSDPLDRPVINPNFLAEDIDTENLLVACGFARKLASTKVFSEAIVKEISPGPAIGDVEGLKEYIKDNFFVVYHPVGTAAMLPKELGGVVDSKLKVYGAKNVRVVDASIFPIEFSVHPMATIYAVAEKAADIIGGST
ncbi:choline dehydrogenase [Moniliophthora roreri MCA 2997]|uniref:Choline dehydrogenase n=1 Tax=Moniliophthora roreri (strain MCA 2997) TaxID=1381753 RepID=V2X089_MONRO|nr:choline dehydrogenase [Moniliophthora roreri MCA 2997]